MRKACVLACLAAFPLLSAPADSPHAALALAGAEHAPERLVAIHEIARSEDPAAIRALAAAYARLEAEPQSGFSIGEKVAILRTLGAHRDPAAGPCVCRGLQDPSREVRLAALGALREVPDAQAVPHLIDLLEQAAARDPAHHGEDLGIATQANRILETLTNRTSHFDTQAGSAERQIAVTRWRQWWEAHRGESRRDWQRKGFEEAGIRASLPPQADGVPALLEALKDAQPAWIRENAWELLAGLDPAATADLAKGLSHEDPQVRTRAATALYRVLMRGNQAGLPEPAGSAGGNSAFPQQMKAWWDAHGKP